MLLSNEIQAVFERSSAGGEPLYSQQEILDTLTGFFLALIAETDVDLTTLGEAELEILAMALQHAELHPDMEQHEYDEGLLRFLEAHPPHEDLLADLQQALQSTPQNEKQQQKKSKKKTKVKTKK